MLATTVTYRHHRLRLQVQVRDRSINGEAFALLPPRQEAVTRLTKWVNHFARDLDARHRQGTGLQEAQLGNVNADKRQYGGRQMEPLPVRAPMLGPSSLAQCVSELVVNKAFELTYA